MAEGKSLRASPLRRKGTLTVRGDGMNFNQLAYFVEIIRCGSINRAARKLDVNPSTLLSGVNGLENEMGCSLLVRSKHGVQATREGEEFFADCLNVLNLQEKWNFLKFSTLGRKKINVQTIPIIYHSLFSEVLSSVLEKNGDYVLNVMEHNIFEIESSIGDRDFSIAVGSYLKEDMTYISSLLESFHYNMDILGEDEYRVIVRKGHPLARKRKVCLKDLEDYSVVDSFNKTIFKFGLQNIFTSVRNTYINEKIFQIDFISKTDCFGLMPSVIRYNDVVKYRDMKLLKLDGEYSPLVYIVIYPSADRITREERAVVDVIKKCFGRRLSS